MLLYKLRVVRIGIVKRALATAVAKERKTTAAVAGIPWKELSVSTVKEIFSGKQLPSFIIFVLNDFQRSRSSWTDPDRMFMYGYFDSLYLFIYFS